MSNIKYFTIYGERCSGTNFLEETILANFNMEITWKYSWKHFFGFYNFENNDQENETLFIGIIRNPFTWLNSFHSDPHHVPLHNRPILNFLLNEFYSIDQNNKIISQDFNYVTNEKYKNIFELRKMKNDYLMNIMPTKVKNYILIRYEDLASNSELILNKIKDQYKLTLKNNLIVKINYHKKQKNKIFVPKPIKFSNDILDIIKNNLDKEQEETLLNYSSN